MRQRISSANIRTPSLARDLPAQDSLTPRSSSSLDDRNTRFVPDVDLRPTSITPPRSCGKPHPRNSLWGIQKINIFFIHTRLTAWPCSSGANPHKCWVHRIAPCNANARKTLRNPHKHMHCIALQN
jgi:hypothetical protein